MDNDEQVASEEHVNERWVGWREDGSFSFKNRWRRHVGCEVGLHTREM